MTSALGAYVSFTLLFAITPGVTTAVVVRQALQAGGRAGLAAAAGAAVANVTHALAAGVGLAVLARTWPSLLDGIRVGGGLYLLVIGLRGIWHALQGDPAQDVPVAERRHLAAFRQGLVTNLLNPSIVTFYLAGVPSFLPQPAPAATFAGYAAIHVSSAFACHCFWAASFDRLGTLLATATAKRWVGAISGLALLVLAIRVL